MFWNKKKRSSEDRGLPELPATPMAIPSMKDYHNIAQSPETKDEEEIHSLPAFPDSPMKKGFSQSAIKDAIGTEDVKEDLPPFPKSPEERRERNIPLLPPPRKTKIVELEEWKPLERMEKIPRKAMGDKPVFVKLEKFEDARESLDIVKNKLASIDDLLSTIRDVKTKEDQELSSWEKEIESIKARLNSVTSEIFSNSYG